MIFFYSLQKSLCKILGITMAFLDTMYVSRFSSHILSLPCGTSSLPSAFLSHVPFDPLPTKSENLFVLYFGLPSIFFLGFINIHTQLHTQTSAL